MLRDTPTCLGEVKERIYLLEFTKLMEKDWKIFGESFLS